jgi:hypothetical protein
MINITPLDLYMILGIDINMAKKDDEINIDNADLPRGLKESRTGAGGSAKRFPKEGGHGESVLGRTTRCEKQDRKKPGKTPGKRYSKPMSPVYRKFKEGNRTVIRKVGNRINANQYCGEHHEKGPCGQPRGEGKKKKMPTYYEYRRNRADADRSVRWKKQKTTSGRRYRTKRSKKK